MIEPHPHSPEFARYLAAQRACIEASDHPDLPAGSEAFAAADARAKASVDAVYEAARAVAERKPKTARDVAELAAIFCEELSVDVESEPRSLDDYLRAALLRSIFAVGGTRTGRRRGGSPGARQVAAATNGTVPRTS